MKFYDVAKDYIERMEYLEQGINAETGEMSDDGTQLAIWTAELTQDLKDKSANVIAVVRNHKSTSTEIYDESLIDKKFIEVVTTEKISKEKIKAALKAGEEVQGARLVENKNLKIG